MLNSFSFVRSITTSAVRRSLAGSGACMTVLLALSTAAIGGCHQEFASQAPNNEDDSSDSADVDAGSDDYAVACDLSSLATECTPDWYTDEECDPSNNVEACEWDGGDCCEATCIGPECGLWGFECRDPATGGSGVPVAEPLGSPCDAVADPLAASHLKAEVSLLSSDALKGRRPSSAGDITTRDYITKKFECLGLSPSQDSCYQVYFNDEDGTPTANVVGMIPGSDPAVADEIIVIGGHHDHLGIEDGEIMNGANDNTSGLVGVLSLADMMTRGPAPRRTVYFVAFGSEEENLDGSKAFVSNPPAGVSMDNVVYMVNVDMIGTYDLAGTVDVFGLAAGTLGRELVESAMTSYPEVATSFDKLPEDEASDSDPFCKLGVPYLYFATEDPCWHEACDDAERMDFDTMSKLLTVLHEVSLGLANSDRDLRTPRTTFVCNTD